MRVCFSYAPTALQPVSHGHCPAGHDSKWEACIFLFLALPPVSCRGYSLVAFWCRDYWVIYNNCTPMVALKNLHNTYLESFCWEKSSCISPNNCKTHKLITSSLISHPFNVNRLFAIRAKLEDILLMMFYLIKSLKRCSVKVKKV